MHVSLVGIQWEMESRFNTIQASLWVSQQLLTPPPTLPISSLSERVSFMSLCDRRLGFSLLSQALQAACVCVCVFVCAHGLGRFFRTLSSALENGLHPTSWPALGVRPDPDLIRHGGCVKVHAPPSCTGRD